MFEKKAVKFLKLPLVRNCFTLAMTSKLVVIINSLKVPKIKKILLYEIKFIVPNYSCLQNAWMGGYRPQIPPNKIPGYATAYIHTYFMDRSPSSEANWFSASQEIPRILWNLKVHYRIRECLPPVPILSQLDPVHTHTSHFLSQFPGYCCK